jgi:hypothetical protein
MKTSEPYLRKSITLKPAGGVLAFGAPELG